MSIPTSKQIAAQLAQLETEQTALRTWIKDTAAAHGALVRRVAVLEVPPAPAAATAPAKAAATPKRRPAAPTRTKKR